MNETILGINIIIYFAIGIIYALCTIERHFKQQDIEYGQKDDKVTLFFMLSIFWIVFIIGDLIDISKKSNTKNRSYIVKENKNIPVGLIQDKLVQYGFLKPTSILVFPSTRSSILEYWGDLNLIQTLINHGSIQTIASYNDAFESLVYMQNHIYDISLYLLFNSMKFLGVFAISGDIYTEPQNFKLNFYYGDTIPTEIYNCINKIKY